MFQENVWTDIVDLKDERFGMYDRNDSAFATKLDARCGLVEDAEEAQQRDVDHEMDFIRKLSVKAAGAAMAQSGLKGIAEVESEKVTLIQRDTRVRFDFSIASVSAQEDLMTLEDV